MKTLRGGISDVVNTLNKVRNRCTDPVEQAEIQKILRVLFTLWEEVIRQEINSKTKEYENALSALRGAEAASKQALKDVHQTAAAIKAATKAAKAVDAVVKVFVSLAA